MEDWYLKDARELCTKFKAGGKAKERVQILMDLAQASFLGGETVQAYIGSVGVLDALVELISSDEAIRTKVLEAICVIALNHRPSQDKLRDLGLLPVCCEMLMNPEESVRMWSASALFVLCANNLINQKAVLQIDSIKDKLEAVVLDNWQGWDGHNEAEEVLKMLGLKELE